MIKKRGKPVSFDAMVKFFMHTYHIPTKRDVEKILNRMERIEAQLRTLTSQVSSGSRRKVASRGNTGISASGRVLEVIQKSRKGIDIAGVQAETGFGEKKLRNIVFRLNKLKKIQRKSRGIYIAA